MAKIAERIYLDKERLDYYFEQVSDPVKFDKVPVWKWALGITGPTAEATQQRTGRSFTDHEKMDKLVDALGVNLFTSGSDDCAVPPVWLHILSLH